MTQLEEKIKQLETLLELSYISIPINHLKKAGWSDEEICIIIDHFMNGGMLSEIIAPAKNTAGNDKIHLSVDALQDFDAFFSNRKRQIPGLVDRIAETRLNKEINEMNNEKR